MDNLSSKKELFLKNLKGKKRKYKKYLGSPLRYPGGKGWAVGYVVERLPENLKRIVSPFFGGGTIEIALAKELGIEIIGFEIFDILVNYWKVQIEKPPELYQELLKLKPTKEVYDSIKETLKKHWYGIIKLPTIKLAAYFYFNYNLSYGPGFLGWMSSIYTNEKKYYSMLKRVKNFNVNNISVDLASFEQVIPEFKNDFLLLDPPYYIGKDSKVFKGLYPQRNFPIYHNNFNHELLRDLLYQHKGKFILFYNDCSVIREYYKDFEIIELPIHYTMGQGETRIGLNRNLKNATHIKKAKELLIIK